MDALSEGRLSEVHPILAGKVRTASDMLALEDLEIRVTQGLRSWNLQAALYAQGKPGEFTIEQVNALRRAVGLAPISPEENSQSVTRAAPGHSWHNFGLAVDVVPNDVSRPGWQPDWNAEHPAWKRIEQVTVSLGMVAGAYFRTFPDAPHVQLTGRFPANPTEEVRQLFRDGGIQAVWDEAQIG